MKRELAPKWPMFQPGDDPARACRVSGTITQLIDLDDLFIFLLIMLAHVGHRGLHFVQQLAVLDELNRVVHAVAGTPVENPGGGKSLHRPETRSGFSVFRKSRTRSKVKFLRDIGFLHESDVFSTEGRDFSWNRLKIRGKHHPSWLC